MYNHLKRETVRPEERALGRVEDTGPVTDLGVQDVL